MAADEPLPASSAPLEGPTSGRRIRVRLRFGLKSLMLLPILAAAVLMAADRWTAIPWSGPQSGGHLVFTIVDGATGQTLKGASLTMVEGGVEKFAMEAPFGVIHHFGGHKQAQGYRSLVRDTRRLDVGDLRIKVTADGFEDFEAGAAEISRDARRSRTTPASNISSASAGDEPDAISHALALPWLATAAAARATSSGSPR
jgi:hypothetical protein